MGEKGLKLGFAEFGVTAEMVLGGDFMLAPADEAIEGLGEGFLVIKILFAFGKDEFLAAISTG